MTQIKRIAFYEPMKLYGLNKLNATTSTNGDNGRLQRFFCNLHAVLIEKIFLCFL